MQLLCLRGKTLIIKLEAKKSRATNVKVTAMCRAYNLYLPQSGLESIGAGNVIEFFSLLTAFTVIIIIIIIIIIN